MSDRPAAFDVIVFGAELTGEARDNAREALAHLLKIDAEEAERCLGGQGVLAKHGVSATEARLLQEEVSALGLRCAWRPARDQSAPRLELVPLDEGEQEELSLTCPACGYEHTYHTNKPKPDACEQCGVVFTKFEKVAGQRAERDKVRRDLLAGRQRALEAEEARKRQLEEQRRREELEKDIARELQIRRSRWRVPVVPGSLLFVAGLAAGAAGMYFLDRSSAADAAKQQQSSLARTHVSRDAIGKADPALMAHIDAAPAARPAVDSRPPAEIARAETQATLSQMREELGHDLEWNGLLDDRLEQLGRRGEFPAAVWLMEKIADIRQRYAAGVRLSERLQAAGKATEAQDLLDWLELSAEKEQGQAPERVSALCEIAARQSPPAATLARAVAIAGTIADPAARAAASAELGAAHTKAGDKAAAETDFAEANQSLHRIEDPAARGLALTVLARSYASAGSRGGALLLLEDAGRIAASLPDPGRRRSLRLAIASAYGDLNDRQSLMAAADSAGGALERDRMVYRFASRQLSEGRFGAAAEAAASLESPVYRARAFGLAAALGKSRPDAASDSSKLWTEAGESAGEVAGPAERAAVLSELARYAARSGAGPAAGQYFGKAEEGLKAVDDPEHRDTALAVVAGNEARASRFDEALRRTAEIGNPELSQSVRDDIEYIRSMTNAAGQ